VYKTLPTNEILNHSYPITNQKQKPKCLSFTKTHLKTTTVAKNFSKSTVERLCPYERIDYANTANSKEASWEWTLFTFKSLDKTPI